MVVAVQSRLPADFPECSQDDQPELSRDGIHTFVELVFNSVKLINGHYQIALPLRKEVNIPNNRSIARQRILNLRRRFKKDFAFHVYYTTFMKDVIFRGYAEKVPVEDLERSDV